MYQNYHVLGLKSLRGGRLVFRPRYYALLARLVESNVRGISRFWKQFHRLQHSDATVESSSVGRYLIEIDGRQPVRVAIDAADGRAVRDSEALAWCDIYFKTNWWPSRIYDEKVQPLLNGNGLLSPPKIQRLKKLRDTQKSVDLYHCARIWQPSEVGPQKCLNIIEHQVRLFETLSRLNCKKELLAIVPTPLLEQNERGFLKRLEACGVKCQSDWGDITTEKFWAALARAKIAFLRMGDYLSISWRLTDLFAMGACVVCDGVPYANWYEPLVGGVHFEDGRCRLGQNFSLPNESSYTQLQHVVEKLLAEENKMLSFRRTAADYFDNFGTPEAVASHLLKTVVQRRTYER